MVDAPDITQDEARAAQPRIVEAVFTSANIGGMGRGVKAPLAKLIEKAMSEAVEFAYSHGITEPEQVRDLMQVAREKVKERYAKAVAEATSNLAG